MSSSSLLRLGSCVTYEGDHISRHAGKNSTYEVTLRNSASGIPVVMVSARNVADKASAISCPLHTSSGADSSVNFNCTPQESIKEAFDSQCKPILQAVATGEEQLGTIVIDSAGSGRNRITTSLLEQIMGYFAAHQSHDNNNHNSNSSSKRFGDSSHSHHHFSPTSSTSASGSPTHNNNNNNSIERAHASLVEIDTRGELVDVLDPSSPHAPRIDENFDAQSVHVSNSTLLDIFPRTNRSKIARSVIAGKHAVCTIFIRRKFDGSLGAITIFCLQALGDGIKSSKKKSLFRNTLQDVCEGLSSDPMPPTLPFSRSNLTFLMKGALCQTHPTSWIVALSPWYENADDKETFADSVIVMKSARAVASLTDLSTRSMSSSSVSPRHHHQNNHISPAQQNKLQQQQQGMMATSTTAAAVQGNTFFTTSNNNDNNNNADKIANFYDNAAADELSPQTPMMKEKPVALVHNNNINSSNPTSPAPKENSIIPQPTSPVSGGGGSGLLMMRGSSQQQQQPSTNSSSNEKVTAVTQLLVQVRQLESLVSNLQGQLKKSNEENQVLKMKNLTLTTQIGDVEAKATHCESIVLALQENGKFGEENNITTGTNENNVAVNNNRSSTNNNNINNQQLVLSSANNNNYSSASSSSQRRRLQHLLSPAVELPSSTTSGTNNNQQQQVFYNNDGEESQQQSDFRNISENARSGTALPYNNNNSSNIADEERQEEQSNNNNNISNLVSSGLVWSRRHQPEHVVEPGTNSFSSLTATSSMMTQNNTHQNNNNNYYNNNQQQQYNSAGSSNNKNSNGEIVVVGYNFDLTEEEEEAVRLEMEKRGIKM